MSETTERKCGRCLLPLYGPASHTGGVLCHSDCIAVLRAALARAEAEAASAKEALASVRAEAARLRAALAQNAELLDGVMAAGAFNRGRLWEHIREVAMQMHRAIDQEGA